MGDITVPKYLRLAEKIVEIFRGGIGIVNGYFYLVHDLYFPIFCYMQA